MDATHLNNSARDAEQIERNILIYSFQKDAYQGHKIEGGFLLDLIFEKSRVIQYLEKGLEIAEIPQHENVYIGIAVHHASDYHFVQGLTILVSIFDHFGYEVGKKRHFYHPRPGLHHYGSNWYIPKDGNYTLRVQIGGPNAKMGVNLEDNPLPKNLEVDFPSVMIHTGHGLT